MIISETLFYIYFIGALIILLALYLTVNDAFIEYRHSSVNNNKYGIQEIFQNTQTAADMLAKLHDKMIKFTVALKDKFPTEERVNRLWSRINLVSIEEAPHEEDSTSYTINKGELIAICLRKRPDTDVFHDDNTLWFVVAHELAHVMSVSEGHNQEFLDNFKFILKESHQLGFYDNPVDYRYNPITYCGLAVTNNPFYS